MKLSFFAFLVALSLILTHRVTAQSPNLPKPQYDAVKDFSLNSNPNGVWSYGSLDKYGDPLTLYTTAMTNCAGESESIWGEPDCNTPWVLHNDSNQTICFESICVPPYVLHMDIGNNGAGPFITVLRWTTPQTGTYLFVAMAEGLDWYAPTNAAFRIIYNSKKQLAWLAISSYEVPTIFRHQLTLSAGDTIDFAVDMGSDHDWHFNSTGVAVKVAQVK